MHLKRIEMRGFKSFADPVEIDFTNGINGIVGPNGCGKSNIVDAIKWVLGEQSAKSLRGSAMADVIFAGSDAKKPHSYAEVSLIFDNTDQHLKVSSNEVGIVRRLYRSGESEYFLNKVSCRLKDIVDLMLDSGIGRDSLSIISQGAIASLAQAKPEERRAIFEEASGVAKYKKRKLESLRKLERTEDHLLRVSDIINELETQESNLRKQAQKAKMYQEAKTALEKIEVGVLVKEVDIQNENLLAINNNLADTVSKQIEKEMNSTKLEKDADHLNEEIKNVEKNIYTKQEELLKMVSNISNLETQRSAIEQQKEHWKSQVIDSSKVEIMAKEINDIRVQIQHLDKRKNEEMTKSENLVSKIYGIEEQIRDKNSLCTEISEKLNSYKNRLSVIDHYLNEQTKNQKQINDLIANQTIFKDVIDKVSALIKVEQQYEKAVSTALGNALNHIICKDEVAAKKAIQFLTSNKAGRATFLPINIIRPRQVREDDLFLIKSQPGFVGICNDLIVTDSVYDDIISNLVGTVVIADNIDNAFELARCISFRYKVVSLDGQVINVGGSLTGGEARQTRENTLILNREKSETLVLKSSTETELELQKSAISQLNYTLEQNRRTQNDLNLLLARMDDDIKRHDETLKVLLAKYEHHTNDKYDLTNNAVADEITSQLLQLNSNKDNITIEIKHYRENKVKLMESLERINVDLKAIRIELKDFNNDLRRLEIEKARLESQLNMKLLRLSEVYELTFENAKENYDTPEDLSKACQEVENLKAQINRLGLVNLLAIEEHEAIAERLDFLVNQKDDLQKAKTDIIAAISEMDKVMIDKFSQTVSDVNEKLKETFSSLFNGGSARLIYSDPDDILETGIEIEAKPPGKSLQNLNLFSGGEKALIALAVLFAIMKVSPVPMCILDEVEATLDQANVERFAKYLKSFANTTQFIVITHRPGTMVECDILYGVTMQDAGVSKMISVKLSEAIELIE